MSTHTYKRSEPGLWTVGYYDPAGKWEPESDHASPEEAAQRVNRLNGGKSGTTVHIAEGLVIKTGDTLVLRLDNDVDEDEGWAAKAAVERALPGVRVGVIVADGQLAVVRVAQPDPRPLVDPADTWRPGELGDTPGKVAPGEGDAPPAVDLPPLPEDIRRSEAGR